LKSFEMFSQSACAALAGSGELRDVWEEWELERDQSVEAGGVERVERGD
jgi:negative regulator of sigma E activity